MQINLAGRQERYNQPAAGTRSFYSNILTTRPNRYPVYNPDGSYGSYIDSKANQNLKVCYMTMVISLKTPSYVF